MQSSEPIDALLGNAHQLQEIAKYDIDATISKILRIVLGQPGSPPIVHHVLRGKALAGFDASKKFKCILDTALLTLIEHGLLTRHGYGNWALYTIPRESLQLATDLAFAEFPGEESTPHQQLVLTTGFSPHRPTAGVATCGQISAMCRPTSPRPRSARSFSTERTFPFHRLRASGGKRSFDDTSSAIHVKKLRTGRTSTIISAAAALSGLTPMSP